MIAATQLLELRKTLLQLVSLNKITKEEASDILSKAGLTQVDENTYVDQANVTYSFK